MFIYQNKLAPELSIVFRISAIMTLALLFCCSVVVQVDTNTSYQRLFGFGGAFTDAAAINIASLSSAAAAYVTDSYYGPQGQ